MHVCSVHFSQEWRYRQTQSFAVYETWMTFLFVQSCLLTYLGYLGVDSSEPAGLQGRTPVLPLSLLMLAVAPQTAWLTRTMMHFDSYLLISPLGIGFFKLHMSLQLFYFSWDFIPGFSGSYSVKVLP